MKPISIVLIAFLNIPVISGQDSIRYYMEQAALNNPEVKLKYYEYQAALQKVPQVGSLPDPELSVGVFLRPMELVSGNQVADIRLMQMFPWFGVLKHAKDEMGLMAKAKFESFRNAKVQVFYTMQSTWYELYKIQQNIRISEANTGILQSLERLVLAKFKSTPTGNNNPSLPGGSTSGGISPNNFSGSSGMNSMGSNAGNNQWAASNQPAVSRQSNAMVTSSGGSGLVDLYRIQIELGELDNNISLLKNQQNTVTARFNSYLNRPANTRIALPDRLNADSLGISLLNISDTIHFNNPMLEMLQYERQSIDARKKMVTRMGYPMVGLGVNYSLINKSDMSTSSMNGKDMIMPMVTVTLPIYRKKYKAMQTESDLMKSATEQSYQNTSNALQTEYYEAMQLFRDAQRRMQLYENQSLLTKKSLEIMIKSFSASGSGLTDILRIRQQMLDYEFKQVEALVDYNTAFAWLRRLMANT